ncbi:MAG: allophanate hydrolase subunit 1 [Actinobacteria bacterium]|nr:allophanate hydrolase subunit 1 [Actinomycetota bacterium]
MTRDSYRYSWGGDEFLFVEIDEEMSLAANFAAMSLANQLRARQLEGVTDICPANASVLIRFNPDILSPDALLGQVQRLEQLPATEQSVQTRVIRVPVWYDDPYTGAVAARFREGYHQEPSGSDLDFAARVSGCADTEEFIRRHHSQPWIVSMVGFVAGLPFLYQLVDRPEQLVVPKYLAPRTDTPALTLGHGGCFGAIYSVRGAGGYQMFGIVAAPIYDPEQELPDFRESSVLFRPGDLVVFTPVDEAEYLRIQRSVADHTYRYEQTAFTFDAREALNEPLSNNQRIMKAFHVA